MEKQMDKDALEALYTEVLNAVKHPHNGSISDIQQKARMVRAVIDYLAAQGYLNTVENAATDLD